MEKNFIYYSRHSKKNIKDNIKITLTVKRQEIFCVDIKGTVSLPERCDFTSSQQHNNNVL